ncbi:MAG: ferredoxin [Nitrospirae bacterium RIFOXYB2_FULL_43_5]|nr:MAG: ferredoxin [Nitrospirae bacterium GWF2_44_13]OGW63681.1 MAG: ferredoxin [Nitrospirae bacterium RIFOXYA2_FULL_44_9]OGW75138.1 MAG: ferredoxin [Nitrospirae bacterium RIFOXYB2_FULL_43_5]HBG92933.1 ferredoxin [Nitrospiraceae bacterium]
MKIESLKLLYFSPTGTTRKIIERIAQGINCSTMEIVDITQPKGREKRLLISENELLIIGVPVYFGRVQTDAIEWLQTIEAHNTPTVCVVVYGNREYDDALLELKDTTVKIGGIPIACAAYIGEHSFSDSETPIAAGRPDTDDLNGAQSFGEKIWGKILSIPSVNHITDITVHGNYPYIDMIDSKKRLSSVEFIAVDNSCRQCGVCAEHCPVGAIDSKNSASIDKDKCVLCHACIKACPENARKIDNDMIKNIALRLSQGCQTRKEPIFFL